LVRTPDRPPQTICNLI